MHLRNIIIWLRKFMPSKAWEAQKKKKCDFDCILIFFQNVFDTRSFYVEMIVFLKTSKYADPTRLKPMMIHLM